MKRLIINLLPVSLFKALRRLKNKVKILFYKGSEVHCVCCGSNFSKFAPFGIVKRNGLCLQCDSLERDRLLWLYLEQKTKIYSEPLKLLHVAPEKLFFNKFKSTKTIDYYPVDKFPEPYPTGTGYIDLLVHDELPKEKYDVIICNHVFQYIEEDKQAMKGVLKMLKSGGWAILQVPIDMDRETTYEDLTITDPVEREKIYGLREHVRWYGNDYPEILREAGFNVIEDDYIGSFSDDEIAYHGFWKGEKIFLAQKNNVLI